MNELEKDQLAAEIDPRYGELLAYWTMPEFQQYERDSKWYMIFLSIGLILILVSVFTQNYIFAVLLVLIGSFVVFEHFRDPDDLPIVILSTGIVIGDDYTLWDDIENFWIAYEPPDVQKLYIDFVKIHHPYISIDIPDDINPVELRSTLLEYAFEHEEKKEESLTDLFRRLYKL